MFTPVETSFYDSAHLRCNRVAIGVREDELATLADVEQRSVAAWENGKLVPAFVIELLATMAQQADAETSTLTQRALQTGTIITYDTDEATVIGSAGAITHASVHRVCAGRASLMVPGAAVIRRTVDGDRQAELLCRASAYGLGANQLPKFFGVSRRVAQYWLFGERPASEDTLETIHDLTALARAHTADLAGSVNNDTSLPSIEVCSSVDELRDRWPEADMPLVTHHACAAHAATDSVALLHYVNHTATR